ncbi:MAG: endo-1,3(4)-beta-glucanase [Flavobacterium psychrophilum]|nr:MAG: endo-1,3(4)-beta-glucanase [Flavobacterium psychrophilum]
MVKNYQKIIIGGILLLSAILPQKSTAQISAVGSGSYTTAFPGTDSAGRNTFPSGSPQISGNAVGRPVPTNDWWSLLLKQDHVANLFNYPLAMRTINEGLVVSYVVPVSGANGSSEPLDASYPITVGVNGLNASQATVADYSDWTVTMNWANGSNKFQATSGIGMPFIYFTKNTSDVAKVQVTEGSVTVSNEMLIITNSHQGADFAVYAPLGSTWTQNGNTYTSTLNGKNYWSMAFIPPTATNITAVANEYKKYAYVFPANTTANWSYNQSTAKLTTTFTVTPSVKEGSYSNVLLGLLPHQWGYLAPGSPTPAGYSYSSIRGQLKTLDGNTFTVQNTFKGILATLPYLDNYSNGFNPSALDNKISLIENDGLAEWTDSYNEGQAMNRLIQTARIADETGDTAALNKIVATVKQRLEDWLKAESGEVAFLFHYNTTWSTLLGYPAGHGQDGNINDHHFHWGYFIHAAAFMEQYQPGWASQWGGMVNLLIRDAASSDRNDTMFPYLRNFSPYAGHSWANGFATFPFGNDQESTSESMQFASSLIHWGTVTNNTTIRDLGIYIYTTEQTATEEYWFDVNERTFKPGYGYSLASRIWGNGYDNQTFWTSDIAAAYGIEMYPIHGGSLYLGHNTTYVQSLWNEIASNTGIMSNQPNPNMWHDTYWQYLAFINPQSAINLYDTYPDRSLKFGISDAQTYHWLHAMNALGTVNSNITANYPIAASFTKNGEITYVAHNYSNSAITVAFSNGYNLSVPARQMATSKDINASGILSSNFSQAYANSSVNLTAAVTGSGVTKVEFYDGNTLLGQDTTAPYTMTAGNLQLGIHGMYAKVYAGQLFSVTNIVSIQVGEQVPYLNTPFTVPGTIEAGNYDKFEGGIGQGISYSDTSPINEGNYRPTEYVDAATDIQEGATVGWITGGEWLEYTINVQNAGLYNVTLRYASGNTNGGGPFNFELDGNSIGSAVTFTSTGDWGSWQNKVISNLPLTKGEHVLRLVVTNGEFNLGKMTFAYSAALPYVPPVANAGSDINVVLPATTATLNGTGSNDPGGQAITYNWQQVYGPTVASFNSTTAASPNISNLAKGVYKFKLTVSDGTYTAIDHVMVSVVQTGGNASPTVSISSPQNGATYTSGTSVTITANASDSDGSITNVQFYDGGTLLGSDNSQPYSFSWTPASGTHTLTAVATDNGGAQTTSQAVSISVSGTTGGMCTETSNVAQQGAFSTGYKATFETVGNSVTFTFELLDTDKIGVVAFLWKESPFGEIQMSNVSGNIFRATVNGFTQGATISYACKFAYSGGMSVTKYISYVVGNNCGGSSDTQAPTNFTGTVGTVTTSSAELLLNASDNSGNVNYTITYNGTTVSTTGTSGTQKSYIVTGLSPNTAYTFNVTAKDAAGNSASNTVSLQATTLQNTTSGCGGTSNEAQQGSFTAGYTYNFQTNGNSVTFTFELLDNKNGVLAYLWRESPFTETQMDLVSGRKFTKTVSGLTSGTTVSYACKFAFEGGMAVTKYFTYVVGNNCSSSKMFVSDESGNTDSSAIKGIMLYPNPAHDILNIESNGIAIDKIEIFSVLGARVLEIANTSEISIDHLQSGMYLVKIHSGNEYQIKKVIIE